MGIELGPPLTTRMAHESLTTDRNTTRGSMISENIHRNKIGQPKMAGSVGHMEINQKEVKRKLKNNYQHFSINLPNSRAYLINEQAYINAGSVNKPITYLR